MEKLKKYIVIILLFVGIAVPFSAVLSQNSPYILEDITISMPAGNNASKKRGLAIKKATKQGFNQLLQNLTQEEDWLQHENIIANVNWNAILEKFVIVKEETSPTYKLTLNLFFSRNEVRNLLHELKIPYAESQKLKLLIIPLLDTDTKLLLWEAENVWRKSLESIDKKQHLLDFILPIGDINEITNITAEMVNLGAEDILLNLSKQYNADGLIVSRLRTYSDNGQTVLESENRWYGSNKLQPTVVQYPIGFDETMEVALQKISVLSYKQMESDWQKSGVIQLNKQGKVFIRFSPKNAADLEKLSILLESFNIVDNVQLRVLNIENSLFEVSYFGSARKLADTMISNGLEISFKGSLWWVSFRE